MVVRGAGLAALVGVVAVVMVLGARHPAPPATPAARLGEIAARLRCPSCVDESAAQADTPAAQAIRADIGARLRAGQSESQIVSYMVSRYGKWILLAPPASGIGVVVWVAPAVFVAGAAGVLAAVFRSSLRRWTPSAPSEDDRAAVDAALKRQQAGEAPP